MMTLFYRKRVALLAGILGVAGLLLAGGRGLAGSRGADARAGLKGADAAQTHQDGLRVRVVGDEGIFLVYDSANPASNPRPQAGYLAYWNDFETETLYVYGRLLFEPADVGQALLSLERDLGIDVDALAAADMRVEPALQEAASYPAEDTLWDSATYGAIQTLMGFEYAEGAGSLFPK